MLGQVTGYSAATSNERSMTFPALRWESFILVCLPGPNFDCT